jgi:hypothetical protein
MNGGASARRGPADTLSEFQGRPEVAQVAEKYADWARTSEGVRTGLQLTLLAMQRVTGQVDRAAYRRTVRELAATTSIPHSDFVVLARCYLEALRSTLLGKDRSFHPGGARL